MGARATAIPCNTAHAFLDDLRRLTGAVFLDMIEATVTSVLATRPDTRRVGILSTSGTRRTGLCSAACRGRGQEPIQLEVGDQTRLVDTAINRVKIGQGIGEAITEIRRAAQLLEDLGATSVIAGCTEIPLIRQGAAKVVPIIDATDCLATAVVEHMRHAVSASR